MDLDEKDQAAPRSKPETAKSPTLSEFLESCAPDNFYSVSDLLLRSQSNVILRPTEIKLHCPDEICDGVRRFRSTETNYISDGWNYEFVKYICKNCGNTFKVFAVIVIKDAGKMSGSIRKLGEIPTFGPPTPSRVMALVGADRDLFLKGRRAELRGLGIGAFAYYRRVLEEQKGRIIKEIGRVAERLGAPEEVLTLFAKAQGETQFSVAIDMVKGAIPESLRIDGHNPLTLLHAALSEGLHAHTDEGCLELATSIRVVLTDLADRISNALKEEEELKSALGRLLGRNASVARTTDDG